MEACFCHSVTQPAAVSCVSAGASLRSPGILSYVPAMLMLKSHL